jgi:hypothetical protein
MPLVNQNQASQTLIPCYQQTAPGCPMNGQLQVGMALDDCERIHRREKEPIFSRKGVYFSIEYYVVTIYLEDDFHLCRKA